MVIINTIISLLTLLISIMVGFDKLKLIFKEINRKSKMKKACGMSWKEAIKKEEKIKKNPNKKPSKRLLKFRANLKDSIEDIKLK